MSSVLILSGGASRRMGQDKASLSMGDRNLLRFQEERFSDAGFPVVSTLPDIYNGFLGPLAGIHSALHHYPDVQSWLIIPVDMPLVSNETLAVLKREGDRHQVPACFEDCPLPLYLPAKPEIKSLLESWLEDANGKRSVYALMKALGGQWLNKASLTNELSNINTPEDWQAFLQGATR